VSKESRLVHIVDDVPELDVHGDLGAVGDGLDRSLTLVLVLDGFLDAGSAAARAAQHLVDLSPDSRVVATFDVDELHDYRARRPAMSFVRDHYEGYDAPRLVVRLLTDTGGTPYLLLHGPEPDNRWEAFARAVRRVVERFGVTRVVSLGSVPMAVPHTRPIAITPHANRSALLTAESPWRGELRIPSSAQALLEVRLGEWGHDALGYVAHIPHYLAQLEYPRASTALLEHLEIGGHLTVDLSGLRAEAEDREVEIARYLSSNEEVSAVVAALEQQYDAFERAEESGSSLLAQDQPLPTGEEIGQQFEQFLAGLDGPDADGDEDRA
jgi:PAC2 family